MEKDCYTLCSRMVVFACFLRESHFSYCERPLNVYLYVIPVKCTGHYVGLMFCEYFGLLWVPNLCWVLEFGSSPQEKVCHATDPNHPLKWTKGLTVGKRGRRTSHVCVRMKSTGHLLQLLS